MPNETKTTLVGVKLTPKELNFVDNEIKKGNAKNRTEFFRKLLFTKMEEDKE